MPRESIFSVVYLRATYWRLGKLLRPSLKHWRRCKLGARTNSVLCRLRVVCICAYKYDLIFRSNVNFIYLVLNDQKCMPSFKMRKNVFYKIPAIYIHFSSMKHSIFVIFYCFVLFLHSLPVQLRVQKLLKKTTKMHYFKLPPSLLNICQEYCYS